jgi:hypothetical protein
MAKAARSGGNAFQALVLIGLIGVVSYDTFQMAQLKTAVATLNRGRAAEGERGAAQNSAAVARILPRGGDLLTEARRHAAQAEQWVQRKRYDNARQEMTAATVAFEQANAHARTEGASILAQLRGAARQLTASDTTTVPVRHAPAGDR